MPPPTELCISMLIANGFYSVPKYRTRAVKRTLLLGTSIRTSSAVFFPLCNLFAMENEMRNNRQVLIADQ